MIFHATVTARPRFILGVLVVALAFLTGSVYRAQLPAEEPASDLGEIERLPPVEVADVQKSLIVQRGFKMDLVAHEPIVNDPVDGCFDEFGNLFIAEMRGYPYSEEVRKQQPLPLGRKNACKVRRLVDADKDGIFESSTIYAEDISWVLSVCCYDGGVFAVAPKYLYYFKDTNNDGVADIRQVVASGFGRDNVQGLANNLKWGPDGLIYCAGGMVGGDITIFSPEGKEIQTLTVRGRDLRFDPRTRQFELVTGGQQFGHSFDDWGQRFICNNSNHIQQVIWPADALDRLVGINPPGITAEIPVEGAAATVFRKSPAEPWRIVRTRRRANDPNFVKSASKTELVPIGFFTSATGVTIYRGDAYPEEFRGNAFIGDVGGNLIHRKTITQTGPVAVAKRADEGVEFVASTDTWFRPTNFINGPDGCLYVCDMYRETIEHPFSIPEDIKSKLDLESGTDRGRIYRLTPPQGAKTDWVRPGTLGTEGLVQLLKSTNGWHRETAQRLLLQKRDPAAIPLLHVAAHDLSSPVGQMLAVRTLAALEAVTPNDVIALLSSPEPQARRNAVQLAVTLLAKNPAYFSLRERLFEHASDPSLLVRFELALGMSLLSGPGVQECWATLASGTDLDAHVRTALLGSAKDRSKLIATMIDAIGPEGGVPPFLAELLRIAGTRGDDAEVASVLAKSLAPQLKVSSDARRSLLVQIGQGQHSRGRPLIAVAEANPETKASLAALFESAVNQLKEPGTSSTAVALLAFAPVEIAVPTLTEQIKPQVPVDQQRAAIAALGELPGSEGALSALAKWKELGPNARRDVVEILLREKPRVEALLAAITDQQVKVSELSAEQWQQLVGHPDAAVKEKATALRGAVSADREKVIAAYRETVEAGGDYERGRAVYKKICSVCHKVGDDGHNVGPELFSVANKSPADLLVAILDPNREAQPKFVSYTLETTQGQVFSGILAGESTSSVTLRRAEAKEDTIARELIESLASTGVSLMPVGVEKDLKPQDIADVITFIRGQANAKKP